MVPPRETLDRLLLAASLDLIGEAAAHEHRAKERGPNPDRERIAHAGRLRERAASLRAAADAMAGDVAHG